MKKLFIHFPLFRLLSPIFSGVIVYLLILLLNNNIQQIEEGFLGEELYVCIGLSYIIQEFSRLLLVLFKKFSNIKSTLLLLLFQVIISMVLCIVLVTTSITLYFENVLGFSPTMQELYIFNAIFCSVTLIYILLFISHQYLYKINTEKLHQEQLTKQNIEDDFKQFKKGINSKLLFESFEALLILLKNDKIKSDDFIDHLATIYRYILSAKEKQLVNFSDELIVLKELISLLNYLPYRNILLQNNSNINFLTVPGSFLFLIENIVRTTILSIDNQLIIEINKKDDFIEISYNKNDKITDQFSYSHISDIIKTFSIYSTQKIEIEEIDNSRIIRIPKLIIQPAS